jgi:DNA-binding transcriptional MerR regulator
MTEQSGKEPLPECEPTGKLFQLACPIAVCFVRNCCAKGVHMSEETKAVVTVSEMARMCGLSRARFYQLQRAGIFPSPERDIETGRPFYSEESQKVCLDVRRRNCGINGKPILFYARRNPLAPSPSKPKTKAQKPKAEQYPELIEALQALGLAGVTVAQVGAAVKEVYPQGMAKVEQSEAVRAIFLHLKRKNSGDNVGR